MTKKPLKILFVTDLCPIRDDEKGLPLTLLNFISDFKTLGAEVVLLRPNIIFNVLLRGRKVLKEGEYFYNGIRCINKNFWTPFFNKFQFRFLKNEKFDVILSHMPSGVLCANKLSKYLKIPYFAAVHSSDIKVLTDLKYSFLKNNLKTAYKEAKNVLPRSFWLKDKIEEIIPAIKDKTFVIPSGIESEVLIQREKINLKAEKFYGMPYKILSAGSLIKRKNFNSLIKAVSRFEDVELIIAGEGKERKSLEDLIRKLNLKRVKLIGQTRKKELLALMEEIPVFILPSYNETFGMVYLEAMAKGCITVCMENSGMAGFIKDGFNGFLTKGDTESIFQTINKIRHLKNPEIIMENALNTAIETERLKMAENYLNLIQNILF